MALHPAPGAAHSRFGQLLHRFRTRSGLTQQELADLSTISVRAIRDLEHGRARRPRQDTVRLIADGLRLGREARLDLELAADHRHHAVPLTAGHDSAPADLPPAPAAVVGRDTETDALRAALTGSGESRVVTVVGLSGVGKTCLAREVAAGLRSRLGTSVLWAAAPGGPPSPIRDRGLRELVTTSVEELVDPEPADTHRDRSPAVTDLVDLVRGRPTLLVVDALGGHRLRGDRVQRILRESPRLRILLTSTRAASLPGEQTFLLAPVRTTVGPADRERLADLPAVRLFLDLAHRARPGLRVGPSDLPLVARICDRLDGLPAALGAAASWLAVYDLGLLARVVCGDPAALFDHLAGAEPGSGLCHGLEDAVCGLSGTELAVLTRLCADRPGTGRPGTDLGLPELTDLTGLGLAACGRALHGLLVAGVVRRSPGPGEPRFRVLELVRAMGRVRRG